MSAIPTQIECVECGGVAHLVDDRATDEPAVEGGYLLVYRCADCMDRFDVVWDEDVEEP